MKEKNNLVTRYLNLKKKKKANKFLQQSNNSNKDNDSGQSRFQLNLPGRVMTYTEQQIYLH